MRSVFCILALALLLVAGAPAVDGMSRLLLGSVPSGAEATVDGVPAGVTPLDLARPPGAYALVFTMDGYEPYTTTVVLAGDESRSVEARLSVTPGTGTLRVSSAPEGASVYLDGLLLGRTPYASGRVDAGTHALELQLDGFDPYAEEIAILNGRLTRIDVTLIRTPTSGTLAVLSSPSGAEVRIDRVFQGQTPYEGRGFVPGTHLVELRLDGYRAYQVQAMVEANRRTEVSTTLEPAPPRGRLVLSSSPSGARVLLDGAERGVTPLVLEADPGLHELRVEADGYAAETVSAEVRAGTETPLELTLLPVPTASVAATSTSAGATGAIRVASEPVGALLSIDGAQHGVSPRTIRDLVPGPHRLALTAVGYATLEETVEVRAGETVFVNRTLVRLPRTTSNTTTSTTTRAAGTLPVVPGAVALGIVAVLAGRSRP